jgi:hypothetical protein
LNSGGPDRTDIVARMPLRPDSTEFKRLMLLIEQDLLNQSRLRLLMAEADATAAGNREKLRAAKARARRRTKVKLRP